MFKGFIELIINYISVMTIIKPYKHFRIYRVINDKGDVLAEFDDYNDQQPYKRAKEYIKLNK